MNVMELSRMAQTGVGELKIGGANYPVRITSLRQSSTDHETYVTLAFMDVIPITPTFVSRHLIQVLIEDVKANGTSPWPPSQGG